MINDGELRGVLLRHGARYPQMEPRDAVKLIYQNEFGPGHLLGKGAKSRLEGELVEVMPADAPLCEGIGNGMSRVMLSAWKQRGWSAEPLFHSFEESTHHRGDQTAFLEKLALLRQLSSEQAFPFTDIELEEFLAEYTAAGHPMVSHSEAYRRAYHPAYRVVLDHCLIHALIEEKQKEKEHILVAIDGRCASGKTTLAAKLHQTYGWPVVHMDDFFLRPEQRTPERYARPGGNIDHERFLEEVLSPLRQGGEISYRPFDCHTMALGEAVTLPESPVVIVEGTYSCHPALASCYDLKVFLTVEPAIQMERILTREGEGYAQVFRQKWIPLEERYFAAYDIEGGSDLCFC